MWLEVIVLNCAGLYLDLFHYLLKEEDFETQKPRKNFFIFLLHSVILLSRNNEHRQAWVGVSVMLRVSWCGL